MGVRQNGARRHNPRQQRRDRPAQMQQIEYDIVPVSCNVVPASGTVGAGQVIEFTGTVRNDGTATGGADFLFVANGEEVIEGGVSIEGLTPGETATETITFAPASLGLSTGQTLSLSFDTFQFGGSNPPAIDCATLQVGSGGSIVPSFGAREVALAGAAAGAVWVWARSR